jgi:hypothetical protein
MATNERCLELQAELLASPIDTGQLASSATATLIGQRRIPGLKLHDDRVIRLLETLLNAGGLPLDFSRCIGLGTNSWPPSESTAARADWVTIIPCCCAAITAA